MMHDARWLKHLSPVKAGISRPYEQPSSTSTSALSLSSQPTGAGVDADKPYTQTNHDLEISIRFNTQLFDPSIWGVGGTRRKRSSQSSSDPLECNEDSVLVRRVEKPHEEFPRVNVFPSGRIVGIAAERVRHLWVPNDLVNPSCTIVILGR